MYCTILLWRSPESTGPDQHAWCEGGAGGSRVGLRQWGSGGGEYSADHRHLPLSPGPHLPAHAHQAGQGNRLLPTKSLTTSFKAFFLGWNQNKRKQKFNNKFMKSVSRYIALVFCGWLIVCENFYLEIIGVICLVQ